MLIKEIANCERPYEKALEYGIESLSDAELLAVIIKTGSRELGAIDLANKILNSHYYYKGLIGLNYINRKNLLAINGIGNIKATQILAIAELSSRMTKQSLKNELIFDNPQSIATYYIEECRYLTKERLYLLMFNNANLLIKEVVLSEGTVNKSLISNREIYVQALKYEAVNIILVHNHPSGNIEPSRSDVESTISAYKAGQIINIQLLDHIIVGGNSYFSMHESEII